MTKRFFVTGTDTDAGKTLVSAAILAAAKNAGLTAFGLKPVAAGCDTIDGQLKNSDALLHQSFSQPSHDYEVHNPIALQAAIAPHIAARQEGKPLTLSGLLEACNNSLSQSDADVQLVEGAGGWLVPINNEHTLADLALQLNTSEGAPQLEVILVVGLRLGCINHAMLSLQVIQASGLKVAGWVANSLSPAMEVENANMDYLLQAFAKADVPCLGHVPYFSNLETELAETPLDVKSKAAEQAAEYINLFSHWGPGSA
ncbi:dethiobiotin synthase [Oceanobacter kriegii]|uniref:dethiobiotin synthase n=1 Tax=Oceanobacter kriegii TaxID=64972 RepID=UPI000410A94C|nr:dethiobiotin synthase [Oceanobacter kriegii]